MSRLQKPFHLEVNRRNPVSWRAIIHKFLFFLRNMVFLEQFGWLYGISGSDLLFLCWNSIAFAVDLRFCGDFSCDFEKKRVFFIFHYWNVWSTFLRGCWDLVFVYRRDAKSLILFQKISVLRVLNLLMSKTPILFEFCWKSLQGCTRLSIFHQSVGPFWFDPLYRGFFELRGKKKKRDFFFISEFAEFI